MTESVLWRELTAGRLRERASAGALVLLPVASTEQHGPHLATGVDDILCSDICRRVAEALVAAGKPAVVAPTLWCGLAEHHVAFGGSFTLTLPTYHALLRDLCRSVLRAGFRQILIVNGHGGNMSALAALTVELTRELDAPIATTTYFFAAEEEFALILEDQRAVLHACEAETSMMMVVRPELVDAGRLPEATGPGADSPSAVLSPVLNRWRSFSELTGTGVLGDARRLAGTRVSASSGPSSRPWLGGFSLASRGRDGWLSARQGSPALSYQRPPPEPEGELWFRIRQ